MNDQGQEPFGNQPAGQPGKGSENPVATSGTTTNQPVTLADLQRFQEQMLTEMDRRNQSQADRYRKGVQKEFERLMGGLKAAGIEPSQEQVSAIQKAAQENYSSANQAEPGQPAQAKPEQPQAQASPSFSNADKQKTYKTLTKVTGMTLAQNDPEWIAMQDADDEDSLIRNLTEAMNQKKARLEREQSNGAAGRVPLTPASGQGTGNPIAGITDPATLLSMGLKSRK